MNSSALSLYPVHARALQVGNGTMILYVDGTLSTQATGLPIHAPDPNNGIWAGVIPLLSIVRSNNALWRSHWNNDGLTHDGVNGYAAPSWSVDRIAVAALDK